MKNFVATTCMIVFAFVSVLAINPVRSQPVWPSAPGPIAKVPISRKLDACKFYSMGESQLMRLSDKYGVKSPNSALERLTLNDFLSIDSIDLGDDIERHGLEGLRLLTRDQADILFFAGVRAIDAPQTDKEKERAAERDLQARAHGFSDKITAGDVLFDFCSHDMTIDILNSEAQRALDAWRNASNASTRHR